MDLEAVADFRSAFYRLVGAVSDDPSLTMRGEGADGVADLFLTRGCRAAQRRMLRFGYQGWRKRSAALSWSGSEETDGGRFTDVPDDFLRAYGDGRRSALVEPNGRRWGVQVQPDEDHREGNFYYVRGEELWLTKRARPPQTLFLDYHYRHPAWDGDEGWEDDFEVDFPLEARPLIVAEAASLAKDDGWLPGGAEARPRIDQALFRAREEARDVARPTKQARKMRGARRFGNRW